LLRPKTGKDWRFVERLCLVKIVPFDESYSRRFSCSSDNLFSKNIHWPTTGMIGSIAALRSALTLHHEAPSYFRLDCTYYKNIVEAIIIKATTIHNLGVAADQCDYVICHRIADLPTPWARTYVANCAVNPWIKDEIHPGSTGSNRTSFGQTKTIKNRCRGRIWSYSAVLNIISLSWNSPSQQLSSRRETASLSIPTSFMARLVSIFKICK
jgi:hypothetical protein